MHFDCCQFFSFLQELIPWIQFLFLFYCLFNNNVFYARRYSLVVVVVVVVVLNVRCESRVHRIGFCFDLFTLSGFHEYVRVRALTEVPDDDQVFNVL